jgi:hypothetical protein
MRSHKPPTTYNSAWPDNRPRTPDKEADADLAPSAFRIAPARGVGLDFTLPYLLGNYTCSTKILHHMTAVRYVHALLSILILACSSVMLPPFIRSASALSASHVSLGR